MIKCVYKILLFTLINVSVFAQSPEIMSYQALIRDNSNVLLENSAINLKIVIRQGNKNGTSVYEESHYTQTNKNGLVSLEIGSGKIEKGKFSDINWADGSFYIETLLDPEGKSNYKINGTSKLSSVPYALHAKSADNFTGKISPHQLPEFYTADEIDKILLDINSEAGIPQMLSLENGVLSISGGNSITLGNLNANPKNNFSGLYEDLQNKPELFSGEFADLLNKPEIYEKSEIDNLLQNIEATGGISQNLSFEEGILAISGGNSISFENWDTNAADDFSGLYEDLQNKPEIYEKAEIDNLLQNIEATGGIPQNLSFEEGILAISGGNSISFENWDTNAADDFSGLYEDLQNKPELFSGLYADLQDKPELYDKAEIDNLIQNIETTGGIPQNLSFEEGILAISGGNSISFENWDTNAADDFSGLYEDLQNKPEIYEKAEIDNLLQNIEATGGIPQNLSFEEGILAISGGNSISFENWDTNAADDFSGLYEDLQNKPELFSGEFADLLNKPEIYEKSEIDNLLQNIEATGGIPQNLSFEEGILSISGGNSISFENWNTNADDFSGLYEDLENKPELFTGVYADLQDKPEIYEKSEIDNLLQKIEVTGGIPQNLSFEEGILSISGGNSISFENWNTNADNFSGLYEDLQNKPELFSGLYADLQNKPEIYEKAEIDNLLQNIEATGGTPQNLTLEDGVLTISGGNSISFENWDTNAADDFSGLYEDLQNKPELFSGEFADLLNKPELFSGVYADLQKKPEIYEKSEIDNLLQNIEATGGTSQNLSLEEAILSISGGNSISFENWDTNAADDFSGLYEDLQNKPELFSGEFADLLNKPELFSGVYADLQNKPEIYEKTEIDNLLQNIESTGGIPQNLTLEDGVLTISGGNSISFENWDTNAADDFDGKYSSLIGAPKVYTQEEVDEIKSEILNEVKANYNIKPKIVTFSSSRNINSLDIGNTVVCKVSATLTLTSGFSEMQVGETINLEVHGTTMTVRGGTGVIVNGSSSGTKVLGNNSLYTGGLIRKIANNSFIVL